MKRILVFIALAVIASSCSDDKAQEKLLLDSVIKAHDKVMADDNVIMNNKMKLKSLATTATLPAAKDSVAAYNNLLVKADDAMMVWMNKFNPDFTGKSHQQIMDYLHQQQAQITKVKAQLDSVITVSNKFINSTKK
jgi:hypothetical protein